MPHAREGRRVWIDPRVAGRWLADNRRSLAKGGDYGGGRPRKDGTRPAGRSRSERLLRRAHEDEEEGGGGNGRDSDLLRAGRALIAAGGAGDAGSLKAAGAFNSLDARDLLDQTPTELLIAETVEKILKHRIERLKAEGSLIDVSDAARTYTRTVTGFGRHLRQMTRTCALRIGREAALAAPAVRVVQQILEEEIDLAVTKLSAGRLGGGGE